MVSRILKRVQSKLNAKISENKELIKETANAAYLNHKWDVCECMYNQLLDIDDKDIDATVGLMTVLQERKEIEKVNMFISGLKGVSAVSAI